MVGLKCRIRFAGDQEGRVHIAGWELERGSEEGEYIGW